MYLGRDWMEIKRGSSSFETSQIETSCGAILITTTSLAYTCVVVVVSLSWMLVSR